MESSTLNIQWEIANAIGLSPRKVTLRPILPNVGSRSGSPNSLVGKMATFRAPLPNFTRAQPCSGGPVGMALLIERCASAAG